jgi:glycosyltransferase involved in cell wall biosynthesis
MNRICGIFNLAAHYRAPIYKQIDKELHCDFFIGDNVKSPMKKMNYNELTGFKKELKNTYLLGGVYWQKGAVRTIFSDYKNYIITGEPHCLSTWVILLLARITSKKTYLWTHGWYDRETKIKTLIKKVFFGLANHVLLYGDYARDLMIKEGFKADKLHCIYNSLDYDTQIGVRKSLKETDIFKEKFGNDFPVLCYVGRIQKSKRLDLLIESMIILKDKYNKPVNLVIVGKESEETNLTQLVEENNLSSAVWFYGPSYNEYELGSIFFNSKLCVSPGNVGLTAIHALTYGCPVITHNNFSNQMPEFEVINPGVTGDFFQEGDVDNLAIKINEWLNLHPNNDEITRNECYKVIDEKYNPHYQIEVLKSVLDK